MERQPPQSHLREKRRSFHGEPHPRSSKRHSRTEESFRHSIHGPELQATRRTTSRQSQHRPRRTSSATPRARPVPREGVSSPHARPAEAIALRDLPGLQGSARHHHNTPPTTYQPKVKANFTLKENPYIHTYAGRIVAAEMGYLKLPSSCRLPASWTASNDQFIAYLATHAPLVRGRVPLNEASCERYSTQRIAKMCSERFPQFRHIRIPAASIENRLAILDLSDNDYFNAPYGAYRSEAWGQDI
ncbi:hypothetical protein BP5796_04593 [Coleophoma crateriformis]|uniref:Uncharacterized protein n=1 Tax=Coleophoma crateriformis TaxID=565419 RepID=A0A3D8S9R8_9HELO|nr:hypothetical protein BP5796_04593 [Coleophoma crateriformis]